MSTFTAEQSSLDTGYDIPTRALAVVAAARHLVDFRDGLAGSLLFVAKHTADMSCPDAAAVIAMSLAGLGRDEAYRRAVQITTLSGECWGLYPQTGAARVRALDVLRAVCHDAATTVRDALHHHSCVCHSADLQTRIDREPTTIHEPAGGIQL